MLLGSRALCLTVAVVSVGCAEGASLDPGIVGSGAASAHDGGADHASAGGTGASAGSGAGGAGASSAGSGGNAASAGNGGEGAAAGSAGSVGGSGGASGSAGAAAGASGSDGGSNPCEGVTCNQPPSNTCASASTLHVYGSNGYCDAGQCIYPASDVTCPSGCASGACTGDPCIGVTCGNPPANVCADASNLKVYETPGSCSGGSWRR